MKIKILWVLPLLLFLMKFNTMSFAQDSDKYLHLKGLIDSEEKISADLIFAGQNVYGFIHNHFSGEAPIEVEGTISETKSLLLTETLTDQVIIDARLIDEGTITGKWKNSVGDELPFELFAKFTEGIRHFRVAAITSRQPLNELPDSPVAAFESVIVSVSADTDKTNADKLTNLIYKDLLRLNQQTDVLSMIKSQEALFYEQYRSNTADINTKDNYQYLNWEKRKHLTVIYNDKDLISLKLRDYAYTGGAYGLNISKYLVYDFVAGKKVTSGDIFLPDTEVALSKLIRTKICNKLNLDPAFSLKDSGFFSDEIPVSTNYYLTSSGIGFHYNIYELAGQEAGPFTVFLTFDQIRELVNPESLVLRASF